jgi:phosphoglucosamine mutase
MDEETETGAVVWLQSFSGVRSRFGAGPTITSEQVDFARRYGYCYARPRIEPLTAVPLFAIARDPRATGEAIARAQAAGFAAAAASLRRQIRILDLGILTTPMFQHAVRLLDAAGGVMITASHNPLTDNGWKYATSSPPVLRGPDSAPGGALLSAPEMGRLIDAVAGSDPVAAVDTQVTDDGETRQRIIADFEAHIARTFKLSGRGPRIVLDPNGGAACTVAAQILEGMGIEVVEIHGRLGEPEHEIDTDGISPETGEHRLASLSRRVAEEGALCGIAFDYDADRGNLALAACDGVAQVPDPQTVAAANMALAIAVHRRRNPGMERMAVVVSDATSERSATVARALGAEVYEAETGEINVVMKMHELQDGGYAVPVAVEGANGGTIFRGSTCRDGILVAAAACQVAEDPAIVDELAAALRANTEVAYADQRPPPLHPRAGGGNKRGSGGRGSSPAAAPSRQEHPPSIPPLARGGSVSPLERLFRILPPYATLAAKVQAQPISPADLKAEMERRFVDDCWPDLRDVFESYEIVHYQALRVSRELTGDGSGGWKLRLIRRDGVCGSVWIRNSRTEAGVVRLIADSPDPDLTDRLFLLGKDLLG